MRKAVGEPGLLFAVRHHQCKRQIVQQPSDVGKQFEGRLVPPVHVLEYEQSRIVGKRAQDLCESLVRA
jgi:hypothetical protein